MSDVRAVSLARASGKRGKISELSTVSKSLSATILRSCRQNGVWWPVISAATERQHLCVQTCKCFKLERLFKLSGFSRVLIDETCSFVSCDSMPSCSNADPPKMSLQFSTIRLVRLPLVAVKMVWRQEASREKLCVWSAEEFLQ